MEADAAEHFLAAEAYNEANNISERNSASNNQGGDGSRMDSGSGGKGAGNSIGGTKAKATKRSNRESGEDTEVLGIATYRSEKTSHRVLVDLRSSKFRGKHDGRSP